MEVLSKTGLDTLWSKIKAKFALISDLNALTTKVSTLEASLKSLTKTVNNLPTAVTNDQKYLRKDKDDSTSYNITAKGVYKAKTA